MDNESRFEEVEVTAKLVRTSANAVLLEFANAQGLVDQQWFPKSQLGDKTELPDGMCSTVMPRWLAEDRGVL